MKGVEGNADRQKDIEMRRMVDDADARQEPLEILEQEIPVFEKPEHAQVDADADDEPDLARIGCVCFANDPAELEIHRGRGKEERGERRIPRAVKNVARDHEQVLARLPGPDAPIRAHHDREEDDERQRIKQHGRPAIAYLRRQDDCGGFCCQDLDQRMESKRCIGRKVRSPKRCSRREGYAGRNIVIIRHRASLGKEKKNRAATVQNQPVETVPAPTNVVVLEGEQKPGDLEKSLAVRRSSRIWDLFPCQ